MSLPKWATTVTPLSKTIALILFITLPILGFCFGLTFQQNLSLLNQQTIDQANNVSPSIQPSSSVSLTLRGATLKIPSTWWHNHVKNEVFPIEAYEIHPVKINRSVTGSDFLFRVDKTSSSTKIDELAKMWHIIQIDTNDVLISEHPGKQIIGIADPNYPHYNSRFGKNDKVAITVFEKDGYSYQFLGRLNNYEEEYFQTIQSISFQISPTQIHSGKNCLVNGVKFLDGQSVPADMADKCNTCRCSNGGLICSKKACPGMIDPTVIPVD